MKTKPQQKNMTKIEKTLKANKTGRRKTTGKIDRRKQENELTERMNITSETKSLITSTITFTPNNPTTSESTTTTTFTKTKVFSCSENG
jgi:hypothetical protein